MAILVPSIEAIERGKQAPTQGELYLLRYLQDRFDPNATVFFQPCFNGDRPDIVIIKKGIGVIIIEVKDWDLSRYVVDEKNRWSLKSNGVVIRSPFAQAFHYKKSFFNIHVNGLLEKSLKNDNFYNIVSVFVYFHHANKQALADLYAPNIDVLKSRRTENNRLRSTGQKDQQIYERDRIFLDHRLGQFERGMVMLSVTPHNLQKLQFRAARGNVLFDDSVYEEFTRLLAPPFHYANQGAEIHYTSKQEQLGQSAAGKRMKIRGVAGAGKTTVLAKHAVNAHRRHGEQVLILTFNLTLRQFIHDKISAVRDDFPWSAFYICNYHRFINTVLANANVMVERPVEGVDPNSFFEDNYYSNLSLFQELMGCQGEDSPHDTKGLSRYKTILIDEIQDYKPAWLRIIMQCFLAEDGELVLFGDEKQNIYNRPVDSEKKTRLPNGFGRWERLNKSFRHKNNSFILALADAFQREFLASHYELEPDVAFESAQLNFGFSLNIPMRGGDYYAHAALIIRLAKSLRWHPNDISIIGSQKRDLQEIDQLIRTGDHQERTITTFEPLDLLETGAFGAGAKLVETSKKYGFNLNSGVMKLSTIHSFKGFESPTIFLLVREQDSVEMVYTGLTRARENLVVLVDENSPYSDFFRTHLSAELPP